MENSPTTPQPDTGVPNDGALNDGAPVSGATAAPSGPTSAAVLASRLTLRTTIMWMISAMVVVVSATMIIMSPKMGAFAMASLLGVVGTTRLAIPGTPFGLAARNKFWDASFCYGVALAIVILTNSAHSLK